MWKYLFLILGLVVIVMIGDFFKSPIPKTRFVRTCFHLKVDCQHPSCATVGKLREHDVSARGVDYEDSYIPGIEIPY